MIKLGFLDDVVLCGAPCCCLQHSRNWTEQLEENLNADSRDTHEFATKQPTKLTSFVVTGIGNYGLKV